MAKKPAKGSNTVTELTPDLLRAYAGDLEALDRQIEESQDDKRKTYETVRDEHGKDAAKALKAAMKLHGMNPDERSAADALDAEAQRFLSIIESSRAPRATRSNDHAKPETTPSVTEPQSQTEETKSTAALMEVRHAHQPEAAIEPPVGTQARPVDTIGTTDTTQSAPVGEVPDGASGGSIPPARAKVWKHSDPAHRDCLDPGQCGGFSNLALCQRCRDAAHGSAA